MHKMLYVLLMICIPLLGLSAHHEESASSGAYVLTMDIKTDDLIAFSTEAEKFFESGVLQKRNAAMGLFAFTAKGANPATLVMEYFYPSKESLPSPDVITDSKAHVEFNKAQREIGNEIISSTLWASVYEVVPPDPGTMSVFYVYYLDVQNPKQYLQEWKSLMDTLKKSGLSSAGYGIREAIAGGVNGETHVVWMGYSSMADLVENFKATNQSEAVAKFQNKMEAVRKVKRTAITSTVVVFNVETYFE